MNPLIKTLLSSAVWSGLWLVADRQGRNFNWSRLIVGVFLIWAAAGVGLFGALLFLGALFTKLAGWDHLVWPFLITGLVAGGSMVVIAIEGWRQIKKKN